MSWEGLMPFSLPRAMQGRLRALATTTSIRLGGALASLGSGRECNICGWTGRTFLTTGHGRMRRRDALCPGCRSLERHRLGYVLLRDRLQAGQRTLHVAPETSVTRWLRPLSAHYLSIDVAGAKAMEAMDLTALSLLDASVSLLFCSHVLEHITDDRTAIAEMRRVLAPGGQLVVQVPIRGDVTDEDPNVTDPGERKRRFDQRDHVRVYGLDIVGRLEDVGFIVDVLDDSALPAEMAERQKLVWTPTRQVFLCRVPGPKHDSKSCVPESCHDT